MGKSKLNIVLHKIVAESELLQSRYDVTEEFAFELVEDLSAVTKNYLTDLEVFLDDGYWSQVNFAIRLVRELGTAVSIAVISENIGKEEYLSHEDTAVLKDNNIQFCSHGVSHAALGVYENDTVLGTEKGGQYRNMPRGHAFILKEEEICYQLKESKKQLAETDIETERFVYPYGIYSADIAWILREEGSYSKAYTCDEGLEGLKTSPLAIPRLLVDNTLSVSDWVRKATSILKQGS